MIYFTIMKKKNKIKTLFFNEKYRIWNWNSYKRRYVIMLPVYLTITHSNDSLYRVFQNNWSVCFAYNCWQSYCIGCLRVFLVSRMEEFWIAIHGLIFSTIENCLQNQDIFNCWDDLENQWRHMPGKSLGKREEIKEVRVQ